MSERFFNDELNNLNENYESSLIKKFRDNPSAMNTDDLILLAVSMLKKKLVDEANEVIERAENIDEYNLKYNFNLNFIKAYINDLKGNYEQANEYLVKSIFLSPNDEVRKKIVHNFGRKYPQITKAERFMSKIINGEIKIFHGTMEIANQMYTYTSGLKKLGAFAKSANFYNSYLQYKSDITSDYRYVPQKLINELLNSYDIFHFHFGTTLYPDNSDLPILKKLGKILIMQYWGSDVRRLSLIKKFNPYALSKNLDEKAIVSKLKFFAENIKYVFVEDQELYECVKDIHEKIFVIRQAINLKEYQPSYKDYQDYQSNNIVRIVHAPTDPIFKGTKYIQEAIKKLSRRYNIDFTLVQGLAHSEAIEIYKTADIIVDQLHSSGYGLFAIESMALAKPVVIWIPDYFLNKYPEAPPVIRASPDNIEQVLEYLINNREILTDIAKRARMYVEKYHDVEKIKYDLILTYYKIYEEEGML